MFSNVPFSHACGKVMSGFFGWLNNCSLGEWCESCSPALLPCKAPVPPDPSCWSLQPMARQAAGSVFGHQRWAGGRDDPVALLGLAQSRCSTCSTCGGSLPSSSPCCWTIPYPAYISGTVLCVGGRISECSKNVLCFWRVCFCLQNIFQCSVTACVLVCLHVLGLVVFSFNGSCCFFSEMFAGRAFICGIRQAQVQCDTAIV